MLCISERASELGAENILVVSCGEKKVGFVRLSVRLFCLEHDFEDLLVQSVCVTLPVFIISLEGIHRPFAQVLR